MEINSLSDNVITLFFALYSISSRYSEKLNANAIGNLDRVKVRCKEIETTIVQEERINKIKGLIELVEVIQNTLKEKNSSLSPDFINDYAFLIEPSTSLEGSTNEAESYKLMFDKDDQSIMKSLSVAINLLAS